MNKRYWKFKEQGLCRRCGAKPLTGKTRCERCHGLHINYTSKFKEEAIANGLCRYCCVNPRLDGKSMCEECLLSHKIKESARNERIRSLCIEKYGGKCVCCGNSTEKYLQLDHVDNDGAEHRRELSGGGSLYKWAVKNKFPKRLQLMCANCHQAKSFFGGCTEEDHRGMK